MHSKIKSWLNWIVQQFQLKPGKPAIVSSLRALVSVLVPLGIGVLVGHPAASTTAILGAWFVGLVSVEGVYRQQATAKIVAAIAITAMLFLANLVHGTLWLSTLTTFLVMFLTGFVGFLGQAVASISLMASIMFIVALAKFAAFPDWSTVLQQCVLCLAGGIWSLVLSLGLWKLRPYKPVIQSVANCYRVLGQWVNSGKERVSDSDDHRVQLSQFLQFQDSFIQALAAARNRWSAAWTAQRAANLSGTQLLALIEETPLIANLVVALVEQMMISSNHFLYQPIQKDIQNAMEQLAVVLQQMSAAIANGKSSVYLGDLDRAIAALNPQQHILRTRSDSRRTMIQSKEYQGLISLEKIVAILTRLANQIHADVELISALRQGNASQATQLISPNINLSQVAPSQRSTLSAVLDSSRNHLTIHSIFFRHALRLACVATIAEVMASAFHLSTGYWITLTAVIALKPNYGGTSQTAFQRVLGTVLGGAIGIAIVTLIHNSWAIGGCLLLIIMAAVAVRPLSFSLFSLLLTPAIILLLNMTSQGGWQIGVERIADSVVGGFLALLGSYLLFPQWERQRLPDQLETAIRANLAYFQEVIAAYLCADDAIAAATIAPLRRQAALENSNTAAAAQRLFSEPRHIQGDVEAITTLIFYIRRFFNSVTALSDHRQELSQEYQCPDFKHFADAIVQTLENAANALRYQPLQSLPNLDRYLAAIHIHIEQLQVDRALTSTPVDSQALALRRVRENTPIFASLEQIAYEITSIHSAIARLGIAE